ncbi:hypothetical protein EDL98_06490 [Ornithobacterium rhinotracheale]|uniref:putative polyvalent protein kinase domain-containing protein n=1 Tax=Ornithobacterium rhinotracheale TaxID=28251 RepID=UPI00129D113A|nr:hypothetical protein [Ornithobacterium rhinotracheale]MRJ10731.1 hypothetical protein [Ornithobacterium rhinotracheale]
MKELVNDILQGKTLLKRLPQESELGRARGGERNVEASIIAARSTRADSAYQTTDGARIAQENALEQYAKEEGIWIEDFQTRYGEYLDHGAENIVYWDEKNPSVVTKVNDFYLHETPLEFFDRLSIHNALFPEAAYTVLGFTRNPLRENVFSVIIEQPFIIGDYGMPYEEVKEHMEKLGFTDEGKTYVNGSYIVEDLHPGNILKTPKGNIVVIDEVALLNTPDDDFDGTMEYGEIDV